MLVRQNRSSSLDASSNILSVNVRTSLGRQISLSDEGKVSAIKTSPFRSFPTLDEEKEEILE